MLVAWRLQRRSGPALWSTLTGVEALVLNLTHDSELSAVQPGGPGSQHHTHTSAVATALARRTANASGSGSTTLPVQAGVAPIHSLNVAAWDTFSSRALHTSPQHSAQQQQPQQQQEEGKEQQGTAAASSSAGAAPSPTSWVDRLPKSWVPYAHLARLEKPIGTWLLAWPCFWSIALAADPGALPDLRMLALFGSGAVLLRGAGCTVNDLWDRELDKAVERTRNRPLAAGLVTPPQAIAFLGAQLLAGLGILVQLNWYSQVLGASSLALVGTYPLMKRITGWPQAFLGLTFNWGALLGWAAVRGQCDWGAVLPLYLAGVSWTLVYDTIYAHQDKHDDVKVGIMSTALTFGDQTKTYLAGFSAATTGLLAVAGAAVDAGVPYYAGVAAVAAHLAWQVATVDLDSRADCHAKFVSNKWTGALLFGGIVADKLLA